jgi:hypothetical protein
VSAGLNVVQMPSLILKDDFVKSLILNEKVDRPARAKPEEENGREGSLQLESWRDAMREAATKQKYFVLSWAKQNARA